MLAPSLRQLGAPLGKLLARPKSTRTEGFDALSEVLEDRTLTRAEALSLVRIATEVSFPPQEHDWNDPAHDLLFPLVTSPFVSLVDPLRAAYARVSERARCAVLAALAAIGTRAAAEALVGCVRDHGWPRSVYQRVFRELPKLNAHADVLFPALLLGAGNHVGPLIGVLIGGLGDGHLDPAKVDLEPLAPLALAALERGVPIVKKQQRPGTAWRFREQYSARRTELGAWLDLAGHLTAPSLLRPLRAALALRDPKLAGFAATSLLRRKQPVTAAVLERVAADHETREQLFENLKAIGALSRFPKRWRTWDAFAAAEMARWLVFPTELGELPDDLELMEKLRSGKLTLYVWKFRTGKEWKAGVSGAYVLAGTPGPVYGSSTFSRFDRADSMTPEQHAVAVIDTLAASRG